MRFVIGLALLCAACSKSRSDTQASASTKESGPKTLLGIAPDKWKCTDLASDAEVSAALGGTAHAMTPMMTHQENGMPAPCNYGVVREAAGDAGPPPEEAWFYDVDCRGEYEKRAELLFAQYAQMSSDTVSAYKQSMGSGNAPTDDAGVPLKAPEDAFAVQGVGKKALDHNGQGMIFLDDDAPCFVRVVGPDATHRLALSQLLAKNLHEANAPMSPHGKPIMK